MARRTPAAWESVVAFGAAYVLLLVWATLFRIVITDEELIFRSLFGRHKRLALTQIEKVKLDFGFRYGGGPLRLVVESKEAPGEVAMAINAKVFAAGAVRAVLDLGTGVGESDSFASLEGGVVKRSIRKRRSSGSTSDV